jgi:hypothetical protein
MLCENPQCGKNFEISDRERRMLSEVNVSPETIRLCPQCREQRRLAFRNERNFFRRLCDISGKSIFSVYRPESFVKVWSKDIWWSDSFNALEYGREFDFNRPFFEQFYELMRAVPHPAVLQTNNQNADFANDANDNRNCYHVFASDRSINCHYGSFIDCRDCLDCEDLLKCDLCAHCAYCDTSFSLVECSYVSGSSNCFFSANLVNCHNCIFCIGLQNKKNCIFNVEVGPETFETFLLQRQLHRRKYYENAKRLFLAHLETNPQRFMFLLRTQNSTGDRLINAVDCDNCYLLDNAVNCSNCFYGIDIKDCLDCTVVYYGVEKSYELNTVLYGGYNFVGIFSNHTSSSFYFSHCYNSQDLFGCVGVRGQRHCIFNKSYSESDYSKLKAKIIEHMKDTGEWGQFFPIWMSPFNYNESVAQLHFPLSEDQFREIHSHYTTHWPAPSEVTLNWQRGTLDAISNQHSVPDDSLIGCSNEDIISGVYFCTSSGNPFRIISQELIIYQKLKIALPDRCFSERYKDKLQRYPKRTLHSRHCQQCGISLRTCFSEADPRVILCEECYRRYINAAE